MTTETSVRVLRVLSLLPRIRASKSLYGGTRGNPAKPAQGRSEGITRDSQKTDDQLRGDIAKLRAADPELGKGDIALITRQTVETVERLWGTVHEHSPQRAVGGGHG